MDQNKQGKNLGGSNFSKTDPKHKDYWATPQTVVNGLMKYVELKGLVPTTLDRLDVCATALNKKCEEFISEEQNTLQTPWGHNKLCWLNPPYSDVQPFLGKAVSETVNDNYTVVY